MPYTPILATLGYILSPSGREVLLVHRNRREQDPHFGKFNGLGGKLEPDEDVVAGMKREILEEAGLECTAMSLRGTISWPGFGRHGEDWFAFVFLVTQWHGTPARENQEGSLQWIALERLLELPLWEGDRHFLPLVFDASVKSFHGLMPYRDGKVQGWSYSTLGEDEARREA